MLFMKHFISSKMVKIVQIPKRASFEDKERNGRDIARMWLLQDYSGKVRDSWVMFLPRHCCLLSHTETHTHIHHAHAIRPLISRKSHIEKPSNISPLHSYIALASNYKEFYFMTPIVWNKSGIFKNAVNHIFPFIKNLVTIIRYKHKQKF
jgi:hypothetical protein